MVKKIIVIVHLEKIAHMGDFKIAIVIVQRQFYRYRCSVTTPRHLFYRDRTVIVL